MDETEVRKRTRAGEDSRTEFKRFNPGSTGQADDISKALVAFANSGGGDLFFGIGDDGRQRERSRAFFESAPTPTSTRSEATRGGASALPTPTSTRSKATRGGASALPTQGVA